MPNSFKNDLPTLPNEWSWVPIGECLDFKNGLNKAKNFFGYGKPIINYMDVFAFSGIYASQIKGKVDVDANEMRSFEVKKGDVLFTRTSETVDEVGISCAVLDEVTDTVFSGFVLRGRPKNNKLNDLFKKYVFSSASVRKQITSKATYTTRALTNGRVLSDILIPVPDCEKEQQAIAEALSDADALIASLEKLVEKKSKVQNSLANTLLISSENNYRFTRIDELVSIDTGGRNTQDNKPDGAYPFFVRSQKIERIDSFAYDKEAVLTAGDGVGTGKIFHYINGKFDAHQRVYILSDFRGDVVGRYFYWQFKSRFYERIMSRTAKSSVDSVRREMIADLTLPIPSVSEQKEIVSKLDDAESEMTLLNLQLSKAKKVKAGMMQELLTGRTRLI